MIKVYIVEDEPNILNGIREMLKELPVDIVGSGGNVDSAYAGISSLKPDLVLMDIKLGHQTSFQLLEKFDQIFFKIVFTTAHQEYALTAIKFSAVDYLLKPIKFSALKEAIDKVKNMLPDHEKVAIDALRSNIVAPAEDQQLILKTQEKIYLLKIKEIIRCESDQSYTIFYTTRGQILISKTMGYYEELLSPFGFTRVHKSHLINLSHIRQVIKSDGGTVVMSDGTDVGISQRKRESFMQKLDELGMQ